MAQAKILVVDDEETIRLTVSAALTRRGFETTTAEDSKQALGVLDQTQFDLAVLDLKLPGSMDGIGLLMEIRARSPETIVMMISAHATLDSAIAALRHGAFDYLLKPFTMEQVVERVEQALQMMPPRFLQPIVVNEDYENLPMIRTAENLAKKYNITRTKLSR